jgi:cell division transport system permease protein
MNAWLTHHQAALQDALKRLARAPLNAILSLLVIGIALFLPAIGWVALDNLREVARGMSGVQQISIFMTADASRKDVAAIEGRLRQQVPEHWRFVAKEEALQQLQGNAGMADLLAGLPRNPLPDAFIVEPAHSAPEEIEALAETFNGWPKVAHVQLDAAWVKRFDAFLRLGKLAVGGLAAVLAAALVAVTFNTIRLQIVGQALEIEVARLIGATDGYIRRPFYYYGALQGALGGLLAALLCALGVALFAGPVGELAALYGGGYRLHGLGLAGASLLIAAGALLGWFGAELSVGLSLRRSAAD